MKIEKRGIMRTHQSKEGTYRWYCIPNCKCKLTKMGGVEVQLMKHCEMNPIINFEEIEI